MSGVKGQGQYSLTITLHLDILSTQTNGYRSLVKVNVTCQECLKSAPGPAPWLPWAGHGGITNETNGTHSHVKHPGHFKLKVPESAAVSQDSGLHFDRARKKIHQEK